MKKMLYMVTILVATQSYASKICSYVGIDVGLLNRNIVVYKLECDNKGCVISSKNKDLVFFTEEIRKNERLDDCNNLKRILKLYNTNK